MVGSCWLTVTALAGQLLSNHHGAPLGGGTGRDGGVRIIRTRLFDAEHLFSTTIMSTAPSTSTSQPNFVSIFNAALESYKRKTKKDLASHPLLPTLQSCDTPDAVLTVLREQIPAFSQSQNCNDGLTKWVTPTVNVLYSFSETVSQGVGLVSIMAWHVVMKNLCSNICFQAFPPATVIFAGISVLLSVRVLYLSLV